MPIQKLKTEIAPLVYEPLLQTLMWRKYGIYVWAMLIVMPIVWLNAGFFAGFLIFFPFSLRIFIINRSLFEHLGIRHHYATLLKLIDSIIILLFFMSIDFSKLSYQSEDSVVSKSIDDRNLINVFGGKLVWAIVVSMIFHHNSRASNALIFPSIMQRRIARIRQSFPKSLKTSLRVLKQLLPVLILFAIASILISPLNGLLKVSSSNIPSSPPSSSSASSHQASVAQKDEYEAFLKPRTKNASLPPTLVFMTLLRSLFNFMDTTLHHMRLFSISFVISRIWDTLVLVVALEMSFHISSIIMTERFSFDPRSHVINRNDQIGDSLLIKRQNQQNTNDSIQNELQTVQRTLPLICALQDKKSFICSHALQDLYDLAAYHPDRRREIFTDLNFSSWHKIADFCTSKIDNMTQILTEINDDVDSSLGEEKDGPKTEKLFFGKQSFSSFSNLIKSLNSYQRSLDNQIRKTFKFLRPQKTSDLSAKSSLQQMVSSPALNQEISSLILCMKSLSRLMRHSMREDSLGMIASSKKIPQILNSFLDLLVQVEAYADRLTKPIKSDHTGLKRLKNPEPHMLDGNLLCNSFSSTILAALNESIYEITTSYYEHLQIYEFTQQRIKILQNFLNFAK